MGYARRIPDTKQQEIQLPVTIDCAVLRAAQRIYRTYCVLHPKRNRQPCGIAINRKSKRGQLIFRENPVLLPGESFVSTNQLEVEIH
ncbi:MAG: hypothetical protein ACTMUB_05755 [cyanobacterium endosymbiont of Rhopalodia musculus]|uniref:hypothetical protein n=1 Tax=cyanobacterium endosymbiont of Epithemia clementina EcSB TaxID=3034674 RepID=UPI0024812C9F|nr:hypothetical protein [cyanobacterium endosymbiont of Epithemia clementina EcSB]WGT68401.1 hypothetical protein P3F56_00615 [cyanobacterium endosymbiont of Epithemia clementina EcSB]